jgi:hypothetical protein
MPDSTTSLPDLAAVFPQLSSEVLAALTRSLSRRKASRLHEDSATRLFEPLAWEIIEAHAGEALGSLLPGLKQARGTISAGTFSTRPTNVLRRAGIASWDDLSERSSSQLLSLTNFGTSSGVEVVSKCAHLSLLNFTVLPADTRRPANLEVAASNVGLQQSPPDDEQSDGLRSVVSAIQVIAGWFVETTPIVEFREAVSTLLDHDIDLPSDVQAAWANLSKADLRNVGGTYAKATFGELCRHIETELGDRDAEIFWARLDQRSRTLDDIGDDYGLTRERVRQIQQRTRAAVNDLISRPEYRWIRWRAHALHSTIGIAAPADAGWVQAALGGATRGAPGSHRLQCERLLLWLSGPYRVNSEGWLHCGALPTPEIARTLVDDTGLINVDELMALLRTAGLVPQAADAWLQRHINMRVIEGQPYLWEGSVTDKAYLFLNIWNRPAAADELASAIGEGHSIRATRTRLLDDPRFMRVDRTRIGLRSWPMDEYTGIVDEIEEELVHRGGRASIRDIVSTVAAKFGVNPTSVEAYTNVPRFIAVNGSLRLRTDDEPCLPRRQLTDEPRCYLRGEDECSYRVAVDAEVVRGSGRSIPEGLGAWLGVLPRERIDFRCGELVVPVTWPDSSFTGPSIGSLRRVAMAVGAQLGDELRLDFHRRLRRLGAVPIDLKPVSGVSEDELVRQLTGCVCSPTNWREALAKAVGVSPQVLGESLRRRGEDDLLKVVARRSDSRSDSLDDALDRLKEIL